MKEAFKIWKPNRDLYLGFIERMSLKELNQTPTGFSNNFIWNIGHIIVVQQALVYRQSGLRMCLSKEQINLYKPGSAPTRDITQEEVDEIAHLLKATLESTEKDFEHRKFETYNELTTSNGFHLGSVNDAISFNNYHEGLHLGYMISIRKALKLSH